MNAPHLFIKDVRLLTSGSEQSVAIEFGDGQVKTFTAKQMYEAGRMLRPSPEQTETRTASQRRADEFLAMRKGKR